MQRSRVTAPISIRQLFGLITTAAIVSLVVSSLPSYSIFTWAVLLWPTLAYCFLWCVGRFFLPVRSMVHQCGLVLAVAVIVVWAACGIAGLGWCVLLLPIAALWMVQVVGLHFFEQLMSSLGFARSRYWSERATERVLSGTTTALACCAITVAIASQWHSLSAKGSAVNGFWMISVLHDSTSFDCQPGNSEIPMKLTYRRGHFVSGLRNPDWSFLGLQRYKSRPRRGRLHVSHWFTVGVLLLYPTIRILSFIRSGDLVLRIPPSESR